MLCVVAFGKSLDALKMAYLLNTVVQQICCVGNLQGCGFFSMVTGSLYEIQRFFCLKEQIYFRSTFQITVQLAHI